MLKVKTASMAVMALIASTVVLNGCGAGTETASVRRGAVPLNKVRLGTPQNVFSEAVVTFAKDPNGSVGGKEQYLSRMQDAEGGQFVAQIKNDLCYELQVIQKDKFLTQEDAVKKMQNLLPAEVVAQIKPTVDDSKLDAAQPKEIYDWNGKYRTLLFYNDKSHKEVNMISATRVGAI
jgi:hypothetical protein